MATAALEQTRTFAVLPGSRFFEHACARVAGTPEGRIDVRYADLDDVCDDARAGRHLIGAHVGDHYGTVRADTQLSAVVSPIRTRSSKPKADSNHATATRTSG